MCHWHCPVRAASACSGASPCPRRHSGTRGSVCGGLIERGALHPGRLVLSESAGFENDSNGALVGRVGAGDCVSRRFVRAGKVGCSVFNDSDASGIHAEHMRHNSRIHGSQSSFFACARVSSGSLLGACVVGSASAAVGSACLLFALVLMLMLQRLHVEGWL